MHDDFFNDDFDDEGSFDYYDGFDQNPDDSEDNKDINISNDYDGRGFPDWHHWMAIGPLSEEIAREERERDRLLRDYDKSDDEY